jgi:hypothetical protein
MSVGAKLPRAFWPNAFPLVVAAVGVIVALAIPGDPRLLTWLAPLRLLMTALVPSIERFVAASNFPVETLNFLVIAWACVPMMSYLNLRLGTVTYARGEVSTNFFAFLFGVVFFSGLALLPILWFDIPDPAVRPIWLFEAILRLVANSAICLGVAGSLVCWASSVAISILYRLLTNNIAYAWWRAGSRRRAARDKRR